jgi:LAO/AO transport system kinase
VNNPAKIFSCCGAISGKFRKFRVLFKDEVKQQARPRPTLDSYVTGVISGDRVMLAQAITLIESSLPADEILGAELLEKIMSFTGDSVRIGITGVPGVGKSTFIESLGHVILKSHKKLAVLSIDPTSPIGGGSILGDKTRMETLSKHSHAFIRPSASTDATGGVAQRTRECMLLCEAAGYNVIVVETVGVGQSEFSVKQMVDFFLLLMLPGAGDELQGIKKGIMELADAIAITKADGDNVTRARQAQAIYASALHLSRTNHGPSDPPVLLTSALTGNGVPEVWAAINTCLATAKNNTQFSLRRAEQQISWFREQFMQFQKRDIDRYPSVRAAQALLEADIAGGSRSGRSAALELMAAYHRAIREQS